MQIIRPIDPKEKLDSPKALKQNIVNHQNSELLSQENLQIHLQLGLHRSLVSQAIARKVVQRLNSKRAEKQPRIIILSNKALNLWKPGICKMLGNLSMDTCQNTKHPINYINIPQVYELIETLMF